MNATIVEAYEADVRSGALHPDTAQSATVERLQLLAGELNRWNAPARGLLKLIRGRGTTAPKGLYIHGEVGRGKTMLMDLFFERVRFKPKRRIHFHEFMAETHERIAAARKSVPGDPIPRVALDVAAESRLLCFDELHVTDIADAMILGRLFEGLFADGVVVVATSNAMPEELYRNGLNRDLFVPFIRMLNNNMDVLELSAARDFRLEKLAGQPLYFTPVDDAAAAKMDALWQSLTGVTTGTRQELTVKGRRVEVPQAANGVARFEFDQLCARPLGASDYLSIARAFHTVMIDGIPAMGPAKRNEARRFINLIDTLYDNKVGLIASADAEADKLYVAGDGAYLFERTVSRLIEMRSESYLEARAVRHEIAADDEEADGEAPKAGATPVAH